MGVRWIGPSPPEDVAAGLPLTGCTTYRQEGCDLVRQLAGRAATAAALAKARGCCFGRLRGSWGDGDGHHGQQAPQAQDA